MKLSKMKKAELVALAATHEIDVDDDATKKDLIAALADVDFDEESDYAEDADFREWWSTASKEERNAYQLEQATAAE